MTLFKFKSKNDYLLQHYTKPIFIVLFIHCFRSNEQMTNPERPSLARSCHQFDRVDAAEVADLEIRQDELSDAWAALSSSAQQALQTAADRIRRFHERQREDSWSYVDELGCELGQKIQPLDRVGVYVPGGRAAYPSSVLMTLIPAKVAGVKEIIVVSPTPGGERNTMVLAALHLAGADRVLTLDLHAAQIQGFFDIPTDNLFAGPVFSKDIKEKYDIGNLVAVSPDIGGVVRARAIANKIGASIAIVDKRRSKPGESEVMNIIGDVKGKEKQWLLNKSIKI